MNRYLPVVALATAFALAACSDRAVTPNPHDPRITPDSIRGDITYYSYAFREGETRHVLATFSGVWHVSVPGGWTPDWRMPLQYWYEPPNVILVSCPPTTAALRAARTFVESRGDSVKGVSDLTGSDSRCYLLDVRLWSENLLTVPGDRPLVDALYGYARRKDLFIHVGPESHGPTLFRPARAPSFLAVR